MVHLLNVVKLYSENGTKEFYFLIHQACMDPWSTFEMAYYNFMPLDQLMMYSYIVIDIYSNIYLWTFLRNNDENNSAIR